MAMINYADKVALNQNSNIADINKVKADDMNELKNAFNNQVAFGWYKTGLNPTFTFVSWDSTTKTGIVTSNVDLTSYLNVGMKVKLTQSSAIKYAFITAITSTQLTLFLGTDYSINSSAISNTYFSMLKAPFGFPLNPDKWTIKITNNSINLQASPTVNAWYNIGSIILTLPIGSWKLSYKGKFECDKASDTTGINVFVTISTANNSNSNPEFGATASGLKSIQFTVSVEDSLSVTVKTPIYLNVMTTVSQCDYIYSIGAPGALLVLKAVCAYL